MILTPGERAGTRLLPAIQAAWPIALIVAVGILVRIPFYLAYQPIWSGDSLSYTMPYTFWAHHFLDLGERTPVYSLFLAFAHWTKGAPLHYFLTVPVAYRVVYLQTLLDLLAGLACYFALLILHVRRLVAILAATFLSTLAGVCFYELHILNMSLSFAEVSLVLLLFLLLWDRICNDRKIVGLSLLTGTVLGITVLTRPELLIFFVILVAGTVSMRYRPMLSDLRQKRGFLIAGFLITVSAARLVFLWGFWMYAATGEFRITTLDGWNRMRTVYNLFDRVEPKDRAAGEILAASYRRQLENVGKVNLREHFFTVLGELDARQNEFPMIDPTRRPDPLRLKVLSFLHNDLGLDLLHCGGAVRIYCVEDRRKQINIGDYLGDVSVRLARDHPTAFLKNVIVDFLEETFNFRYSDAKPSKPGWRATSVEFEEFVENKTFARATDVFMRAQAPFVAGCYTASLGFVVYGVFLLWRRSPESARDAAVSILATASFGTIAVTCLLAGFNRVYSLPFLSIFVVCAAYTVGNAFRIAAVVRSYHS